MNRTTIIVDGAPVNAARLLAQLHNGMGPPTNPADTRGPVTPPEALADLESRELFDFDSYYGKPLVVRSKRYQVGHPSEGEIVLMSKSARRDYDAVTGAGAFDAAVQDASRGALANAVMARAR
jgi:hypothetical protein